MVTTVSSWSQEHNKKRRSWLCVFSAPRDRFEKQIEHGIKHGQHSLEGVGAASRHLLAGRAPPDTSHLALGGVFAAECARVLSVLGDLHGSESLDSTIVIDNAGCWTRETIRNHKASRRSAQDACH